MKKKPQGSEDSALRLDSKELALRGNCVGATGQNTIQENAVPGVRKQERQQGCWRYDARTRFNPRLTIHEG